MRPKRIRSTGAGAVLEVISLASESTSDSQIKQYFVFSYCVSELVRRGHLVIKYYSTNFIYVIL